MKKTLALSLALLTGLSLSASSLLAQHEHPAPVEKKQPAAKPDVATVTGEVVDSYCFIIHAAKGSEHTQCARMCAKGGAPLAILDEKTNNMIWVAVQEHGKSANDLLLPYVAKRVLAKGTWHERAGTKVLALTSVEAAR